MSVSSSEDYLTFRNILESANISSLSQILQSTYYLQIQEIVYLILQMLSRISESDKQLLTDPKVLVVLLKRYFYLLKYGVDTLKIDLDKEGEPAFYVPYEDWIKYVKYSDLEAIVFPYESNIDVEKALKDLGIQYKKEEGKERIIFRIDCKDYEKVEYVIFCLKIRSDKQYLNVIATCGEYSLNEYMKHLEYQYELDMKYLEGLRDVKEG